MRRHLVSLWAMAVRAVVCAVLCTVFMTADRVGAAEQHACDVLPATEVGRILGASVRAEPRSVNPLGQNLCFYDVTESDAPRFAQLQLVRSSSKALRDKGFTAETLFVNQTGFLGDMHEVEGVGEIAMWGGSDMKLGDGLHVLHKDACSTVMVAIGDPEANLERAVIARLQ